MSVKTEGKEKRERKKKRRKMDERKRMTQVLLPLSYLGRLICPGAHHFSFLMKDAAKAV